MCSTVALIKVVMALSSSLAAVIISLPVIDKKNLILMFLTML